MTVQEVKTAIENGASWNGVVYGKDNGKNWTTLFVYLDGVFTNLGSVAKKDSAAKKAEYAAELTLGFGETYNKYGLDVAVGEANI